MTKSTRVGQTPQILIGCREPNVEYRVWSENALNCVETFLQRLRGEPEAYEKSENRAARKPPTRRGRFRRFSFRTGHEADHRPHHPRSLARRAAEVSTIYRAADHVFVIEHNARVFDIRLRNQAALHTDRANFAGLILGCIETKFC